MKRWQAKFLGAATPCWLLVVAIIGSRSYGGLATLGLVALALGFVISLAMVASEGMGMGRVVAKYFLIGSLSIPLTLMLIGGVIALLSAAAALLS